MFGQVLEGFDLIEKLNKTPVKKYAGDLGNIEIGEDGSGSLSLTSDRITLVAGEPSSVIGRGVILHEGTDDLVSQPTGDAGGRIACAVIQ